MRLKPIRQTNLLKLELNIYLKYFCYSPEDRIPSPCGRHALHISLSLVLQQVPHCEQIPILARKHRLLRLLSSAFLSNLTVFFVLKPLGDQCTLRASEKHLFNCLKPCVFL